MANGKTEDCELNGRKTFPEFTSLLISSFV